MLRLKDVVKLCGLSKSRSWSTRHGAFPRPIKLTDRGRTLVFFQDEIADWQTARAAQRRWCGDERPPPAYVQERGTQLQAKRRSCHAKA